MAEYTFTEYCDIIIEEEISKVREADVCDLTDVRATQEAAYEMGLNNLVDFIKHDKASYINYITTGKFI